MEPRKISVYDYFTALQKEYICAEIRSKIYVYDDDKKYFNGIMLKKKHIIVNISNQNHWQSIFNDEDTKNKIYSEAIPAFGLPIFVYNITIDSNQLRFPYRGSVVKAGDIVGICNRIDFDQQHVIIELPYDEMVIIPLKEVVRLTPQQTDEYYYYYPGSFFVTKEMGSAGILQNYNLTKKCGELLIDGIISLILPDDKISRVL